MAWDEYVDKRNDQDRLLKAEFGKIHSRLDTFDTEIQVLKKDVAELKDNSAENKVNFLRLQGRMSNSSIRNPFLLITPIPIYRLGTGAVLPTKFPKTAHEFWGLKSPNGQQLALLIYLAMFYDVQGYENWEQADAESGSEDVQSQIPGDCTLEDAVERHPHLAVDVLASLIGLEEDKFLDFQTRLAELRERSPSQATKRTATRYAAEGKRQKPDPLQLKPLTQPPDSIHSALMKLKDFPRSQRSWKSSHSEPSEQTRLSWGHGSDHPYAGPTLLNPDRGQIQPSEDREEGRVEVPLGSPTEAFSDDRPASKMSLASR